MKKQQIDVVLLPEDIQAITNALQIIRQTLPFLIGMTPSEKQRLPKLGIRAQTFTERALDLAESHPDMIPQRLNIEPAQRYLLLFKTLNPIRQILSELQELVECTQMLAGSEAYASARLTYRSLKAVGKGVGLEPIVDELAQKFRVSRQRESPPGSKSGQ